MRARNVLARGVYNSRAARDPNNARAVRVREVRCVVGASGKMLATRRRSRCICNRSAAG